LKESDFGRLKEKDLKKTIDKELVDLINGIFLTNFLNLISNSR